MIIKAMLGVLGGSLLYFGSQKKVMIEEMEWRFFKDAQSQTNSFPTMASLKDRINRSAEYDDVRIMAKVTKVNAWQILKGTSAIDATIFITTYRNKDNYWEETLKGNLQREMALRQLECIEKCRDFLDYGPCVKNYDLTPAVTRTFAAAPQDAEVKCESKDHFCLDLKRQLEGVKK